MLDNMFQYPFEKGLSGIALFDTRQWHIERITEHARKVPDTLNITLPATL